MVFFEDAVVKEVLMLITSCMAELSSPSARAQPAAAPTVPQVPCGCMLARNWAAAPMREPTS